MLRFLVLAALLLQEPAREKFELRPRPVQGDKLETFVTFTNTLRGRLGDEPLRSSSRGGQRHVLEMTRVDGGAVVVKTVNVVDSYVETQDPQTGKYIRKDDAIQGRTITIERRDGGEARRGGDGVPEHELRALSLVDPLARLFPDKPVAVGDAWDISGEGLKQFYPGGDFTEGKIDVSLREVKEVDGRRCAFLATRFNVAGTTPDKVERRLEITGTVTVWIDRGYVLAMTQSGRLTTTGADPKTRQPNGETLITGELKATVLDSSK